MLILMIIAMTTMVAIDGPNDYEPIAKDPVRVNRLEPNKR